MNLRKGVGESPAGKLGCKTTQAARMKVMVREQVDTSLDGVSVRHGLITVPSKLGSVPIFIGHEAPFHTGILFLPPQIAPDRELAITKSDIIKLLESNRVDPNTIHDIIRIPIIMAVGTLKFWKPIHGVR